MQLKLNLLSKLLCLFMKYADEEILVGDWGINKRKVAGISCKSICTHCNLEDEEVSLKAMYQWHSLWETPEEKFFSKMNAFSKKLLCEILLELFWVPGLLHRFQFSSTFKRLLNRDIRLYWKNQPDVNCVTSQVCHFRLYYGLKLPHPVRSLFIFLCLIHWYGSTILVKVNSTVYSDLTRCNFSYSKMSWIF